MPQFVRSFLRSQLEKIWDKLGARIELRRKRSFKPVGQDRCFDYHKRFVDFDIQPGMRVLDIGSGADPFHPATILVDLYLGPNHTQRRTAGHRGQANRRRGHSSAAFFAEEF